MLKRLSPVILIILIIATRVPLITSDYFIADGDESVVGLMAKEIVDKGNFRIYFWGQQYGLSTIETSIDALAFKIFGMNVYSLKLPMLLLWMMGCLMLYEAVKKILGFELALFFVVLLILFPGWGLWSLKARGGYITAFVFSALTAWVMSIIYKSDNRELPKTYRLPFSFRRRNKVEAIKTGFLEVHNRKLFGLWILMGFSLVITYYAQKLWLLSLLPFILVILVKRGNLLKIIVFILSIASVTCVIGYLARHETINYLGYRQDFTIYFLYNLPMMLEKMSIHFQGGYFLYSKVYAGTINVATGWAWSFVFVLLFIVQIIRIVSRKFHPLSFMLFLSVCLCAVIVFNSHSDSMEYRYLLPMDVPLILCFIIESHYWISFIKLKNAFLYFMIPFMLFNFLGLYQLRYARSSFFSRTPELTYAQSMNTIIDLFKQHGIYYTFSTNAAVFWQLMFYSKGEIMSRFYSNTDRNREYTKRVTDAFKEGKPTAIIDLYGFATIDPKCSRKGMKPGKIINIGHQLSIYLYPEKTTLGDLQFDLR